MYGRNVCRKQRGRNSLKVYVFAYFLVATMIGNNGCLAKSTRVTDNAAYYSHMPLACRNGCASSHNVSMHCVVIDSAFLDREDAVDLRNDLIKAYEAGLFNIDQKLRSVSDALGIVAAYDTVVKKLGADNVPKELLLSGGLANAIALLDQIAKSMNASSTVFMASRHPAGSFYPKHTDRGLDGVRGRRQRRATALVYMDSDWRVENGGALEVR